MSKWTKEFKKKIYLKIVELYKDYDSKGKIAPSLIQTNFKDNIDNIKQTLDEKINSYTGLTETEKKELRKLFSKTLFISHECSSYIKNNGYMPKIIIKATIKNHLHLKINKKDRIKKAKEKSQEFKNFNCDFYFIALGLYGTNYAINNDYSSDNEYKLFDVLDEQVQKWNEIKRRNQKHYNPNLPLAYQNFHEKKYNKINKAVTTSKNEIIALLQDINQMIFSEPLRQNISGLGDDYNPALLNNYNTDGIKAINKIISENPVKFISNLFDELIHAEKLDRYLMNQIEVVLNNSHNPLEGNNKMEFIYAHRAILSGALAISILKGWDSQKILYLHQLSQLQDEPYVSERAIIGLVLALIKTWNDDVNKFNETLNIMSQGIIKKDAHYRAGIFEALDFFLSKNSIDKINKKDPFVDNKLNGFQLFEPPHKNISYFKIENKILNEENLIERKAKFKNIEEFILKLNNTICLDYADRLNMTKKIKNLNYQQFNTVFNAFNDSKITFDNLESKYYFEVKKHWFAVHHSHFYHSIITLGFEKLLIFEKKNINDLIQTAYIKFPYGSYIKYISIIKSSFSFEDVKKEGLNNLLPIFIYKLNRLDETELDEKNIILNGVIYILENSVIENKKEKLLKYYYAKAKIKIISKDYQKAIEYCTKALKIEPKKAYIILQIGILLEELGQLNNDYQKYEQAIKKYKELLNYELNERGKLGIQRCLCKIGCIHFKNESYKDAIDNFKEFLEYNPDDKDIIEMLKICLTKIAHIEIAKSNYSKAIVYLKEATDIEPEDEIILLHIAYCYLYLNKPVNAKIWYEKCFNSIGSKFALKCYGHCELILKNHKSSIEYYKKSLDIWEDSKDFFKRFNNIFKYLEPQGVDRNEYEEIKQILRDYCIGKDKSD